MIKFTGALKTCQTPPPLVFLIRKEFQSGNGNTRQIMRKQTNNDLTNLLKTAKEQK